MRDGHINLLLQCATPQFLRKQGFDQIRPEDSALSQEIAAGLKEHMESFTNFKIVDRKEKAPDHVVLGLQSSPNGAVAPVTLRQIGNEWRLDKLF